MKFKVENPDGGISLSLHLQDSFLSRTQAHGHEMPPASSCQALGPFRSNTHVSDNRIVPRPVQCSYRYCSHSPSYLSVRFAAPSFSSTTKHIFITDSSIIVLWYSTKSSTTNKRTQHSNNNRAKSVITRSVSYMVCFTCAIFKSIYLLGLFLFLILC